MSEEIPVVRRQLFLRRGVLISMGIALAVAIVCFAVTAFLPVPKGATVKDPLRSFVAGVGVAGVAYPLCTLGSALKRKFALSPYFEGTFIAGVLNLAGYICAAVALVCLGFGVYDLILTLLK